MSGDLIDLLVVNNKLLQVYKGEGFYELRTQTSSEPNTPTTHFKKVYVIDSINSGSGRKRESSVYFQLLKPIFDDHLKIPHIYISTTSVSTIHDFAGQLGEIEEDEVTVIFISGDTSINEFANGLTTTTSRKTINIFTIPSGTGNSLALSLGLVDEIDAVKKLLTSKENPVPLNLYEVSFPSGSYYLIQDVKGPEITKPLKFLVVISWAFHASLVADSDTPELRVHGLDRFKMAAHENLSQEQKYEGAVTINDKVINGPFAYWLFTPARRFEPTFEILPDGNIFDDNLYFISFNSEDDSSGKYIMDIMKDVYNKGAHIQNKKVTYQKVQRGDRITLNIENSKEKRKRRFCVDGSIVALPEVDDHVIDVSITGNLVNNWVLNILH